MTKKGLAKNISLVTAIIAIGLVIIFGGYWVFGSLPALLSSQQLRTEQQVQDAYNNGFNNGIGNYTELNEEIAELKTQVLSLTASTRKQQTALTNIANTLLESVLPLETKQKLMAEVAEGLVELAPYLAQLNGIVSDLQSENFYLQHYIAQLEKEQTELLEVIDGLQNYIDSIEMIENSFVIEFWNGIKFHFGATVPQGTAFDTTDIPLISNTAYQTFLGWSLQKDGGIEREIFDFTNWTPESNTKFYAVVKYRYDVNFVYDFNEYAARPLVEEGTVLVTAPAGTVLDPEDLVTVVDPADTDTKKFLGWSLNGTDIIDVNTYPITANTTFFAVLDLRLDVKFMVNGQEYATYQLEPYSTVTPPEVPQGKIPEFYTLYWYYNGEQVDFNKEVYVTNPMTFVAHYIFERDTKTGICKLFKSSDYSDNIIKANETHPDISKWSYMGLIFRTLDLNFAVWVPDLNYSKWYQCRATRLWIADSEGLPYVYTLGTYEKTSFLWWKDKYEVRLVLRKVKDAYNFEAEVQLLKNGSFQERKQFEIYANEQRFEASYDVVNWR